MVVIDIANRNARISGTTATFQLPNPGPGGDGVTAYRLYAWALGKPSGASVTPAGNADDPAGDWCSEESVVRIREGRVHPPPGREQENC